MPDRRSSLREQVAHATGQIFPFEDTGKILEILDRYGAEPHERDRERVHLAILALSRGDLEELEKLLTYAKRDYRDVLYWAQLADGYADSYADRMTESLLTPESTPTRLALLKEAVPGASRIAVLWNPGYAFHEPQMTELRATASTLGVALQAIAARRPDDFDEAFSAMRSGGADAVLFLTSTMLQYHWRAMAERARSLEIPSMGELREFPVHGGLMSYGPSQADRQARATGNIDTLIGVLKREPSRDSPSVRRLELVINADTAKALGLTIPPPLLLRANEVMQ